MASPASPAARQVAKPAPHARRLKRWSRALISGVLVVALGLLSASVAYAVIT